jgi:serine/threonine protein kinase
MVYTTCLVERKYFYICMHISIYLYTPSLYLCGNKKYFKFVFSLLILISIYFFYVIKLPISGSRRFMAPEVSLSEPYGLSADIYSFSIVLWELLTLDKAFGRMPVDEHREKVLLGTVRPPINTKEWTPDLIYTLEGCWRRDPLTRPTSHDVQDELKSIIKNVVSNNFPYKNKVPKQQRVTRRSTRGSTGSTAGASATSYVSVGSYS